LFTLPGGSGHYVMVATPVIRQGQVRLVLGARVDSRSFGAILRQQEAPPNGAVAIVDADHRVVSRNVEEEQYVGTEVTQAFVDATAARPTAPWRTTMRDGRPTYAAFTRSPRTGLRVGLGLPSEEVDGPICRILRILATAWTIVLGLGAGLGLLLGRAIVKGFSSAS